MIAMPINAGLTRTQFYNHRVSKATLTPGKVARTSVMEGATGHRRDQNSRLLSSRKVTGPSLRLSTCMWAPKEPFSTGTSDAAISVATFS